MGTDGSGGGKFATAQALATNISEFWPATALGKRLVVLTGGEPLLQVDAALIAALHALDFEIAVETNGTVAAPVGIDWLCVSPKANTELKVSAGRELKVVVPQIGQDLEALIALPFDRHLLQPMDGPLLKENTQWAIEYCMRDPRWRLSVQTHKMVGIR